MNFIFQYLSNNVPKSNASFSNLQNLQCPALPLSQHVDVPSKTPSRLQVSSTCSPVVLFSFLFSFSAAVALLFPCCGIMYKARELALEEPSGLPGEGSTITSGLFHQYLLKHHEGGVILTQLYSPYPHKPSTIHSPALQHHHKVYPCTSATASACLVSYRTSFLTRAFSRLCGDESRDRISSRCRQGIGKTGCASGGRGS